MEPWLSHTPEDYQQLKTIADRLQLDYNRGTLISYHYYGFTSYTFRTSKNTFTNFLTGANYYYTPTEGYKGIPEHIILLLLASLHPHIKDMIQNVFNPTDRGGTDRTDPIPIETTTRIAYFPKGITDFAPTDKMLDTALSAKIQHEIIKENSTDPNLTNSPDLSITVKVFASPTQYLHVYFNKKSPETIRRVIYKTIQANLDYFKMIEDIEEPSDKELFNIIYKHFFTPTKDSMKEILKYLNDYFEEKIKHQDENLVKNFAAAKQTAMNNTRKQNLLASLQSAKDRYEQNIQSFSNLKNAYLQAKKAVDTFEEVPFTAIEVFLNAVKNDPCTKMFAKVSPTNIQFLIEEPLMHTESETWAKYITNNGSTLNSKIGNFAMNHYERYNTTYDILKYAVQRFFKETFIDQKIKLYTAALLGVDSTTSDFYVNKYNLTNYDYFPHPHIGTNTLTCWGEATRQISKNILENDGEMAHLQLTYALQQMTASDGVVANKLIDLILSNNYLTGPYYSRKTQKDSDSLRESFENILKEFITDETNKINAIIASES